MEFVKESLSKGIAFLTDPTKSFDSVKNATFGEAFKYVAVLAIITAVLSAIMSSMVTLFGMSFAPTGTPGLGAVGPTVFVSSLVMGYFGILIGYLIFGLWLHLWVYIFGGRKGIEQTIKMLS